MGAGDALLLHGDGAGRRRLVCFSFAGGGVAPFRAWGGSVPPGHDVWGISYPGRDGRYGQRVPGQWSELVTDCAALVAGSVEPPYVLYGHSMGALVAHAVAATLPGPAVDGLIVSGHVAPHRHIGPDPRLLDVSDAALERWLGEKGQVAPEVLANADLRAFAVHLLRADISVYGTFRHEAGPLLETDVHVLYGEEEPQPREDFAAWADVTKGTTIVHELPGGHFFTPEIWSALPGLVLTGV
ncbi:thioesterase II family protein [Microbispora sp. KK1-11]|uniref:thioesterase II family protein n=1 Tax=Microbispora sp. KK1-11 TaxID=2053005 RepID=UPI0011576D02|nr:alpha/beta fold hydrolase [Microbispora sp. KK1-11]TQS28842.1 thioesterase [Microbispora sp. KK1-11]